MNETHDKREVAIVIPTCDGCSMLRACLMSIRGQTFKNHQVYVVDNGSSDGTREMLAEVFPEVRLIGFVRNQGFSIALNAGIRAGREPLIAAVNNDVVLEPAWLETLVTRARTHLEEGFWASLIRWAPKPEMIDSAGLALYEDGSPACLLRGESVTALSREPRRVLGACAGAALYRRSMLDDVGLFDERFWLYVEDVDLSVRCNLAGYVCVLAPEARCTHRHMGTASRWPNRSARLQYRNLVLMLIKSMPVGWLFRRLPRFTLTGAGPLLRSPWKATGWVLMLAKFGILRHLPYALRERRKIRAAQRMSDEAFFDLWVKREPGKGNLPEEALTS